MHRAAPTHKELTAKGGTQPAYASTPPARALNRPPSPPVTYYSALTSDVPPPGQHPAPQNAPCSATPPTQRPHDSAARPQANARSRPPPRTTDPAPPETPPPKQRNPGSTDTTDTAPNRASPSQRVAGWSASFDSYVRPPRPGQAPQRVPHADRQRQRPDQPATPNPRSLAFLTVTMCATAASAAADATHPPSWHGWAPDTAARPRTPDPAAQPGTPNTAATDPAAQHATVLSVAAANPTSTPLAIEMTAAPSRPHRRGKPSLQMVNFDSCSGASFGERKWLTSMGCKLQRADTTLHFHGFCDGAGADNTSQWVADVILSRAGYTNTYRVWVVDNSPCVCLIGRDNMVTSKGFGTTLRPCPEKPTVQFDGHAAVAAHTDPQPGATQVHAVAAFTQLSTTEGVSIPAAALSATFLRAPSGLPPGTDLLIHAATHGLLHIGDQVARVDDQGFVAVLARNTGSRILDLPPGSALSRAQPISATPIHPDTTAALAPRSNLKGSRHSTQPAPRQVKFGPTETRVFEKNSVIGDPQTADHHTRVLFAEPKPTTSEGVRGSAWKGKQFSDHDEAVDSFSDNVPYEADLDKVLQGIAAAAEAGDARQRARLLAVLRKHAGKGLWSTQENKTGYVKDSAVSFQFRSDKPIYVPQYKMNAVQEAEVIRQVQAMEKEGLVHRTTSASNFPVLLIDKGKGKAPRLCLDLRLLNEAIIAQHFAIPKIATLVDDMASSSLFSSVDCTAGYSMLRLDTKDGPFPTSERVAFTLPQGKGRYAMSVLTMGIGPAMFVFQATMHRILNEHCSAGYTANYVDDAIVHNGKAGTDDATNVDAHIDKLDAVFASLGDAGIKLGPHKTTCLLRSTEALGCHIENHTVSISKDKAAAIAALSEPRTHKELQTAMGLLGITRRFVPNYAHTAACLHDLLHADGRAFRWEQQHSESFQTLKARLSSTAPLSATDWNAPFEIHADASDTACGAALLQKDANGLPTVLEFFSHKFTPAETRYTVSEREALALVLAVKQWRPFLLANSRFTVLLKTDHRGLIYVSRCRDVNSRLWRWMNELEQYQYDIQYVSGKDNTLPDSLSRLMLMIHTTAEMITAQQPTASFATTTTTTPPQLHKIERLVAKLYHPNTGPALWYRIRWQGYSDQHDTVERLSHLRQDLGHRELHKLRADLATSTSAATDAALPAPAGFSGFTTTRKATATATTTTGAPPQTQHSATDPAAHLAAETRHNASLDRNAPADSAPTAPTKFTPQLLASPQLLPTVTASEIAKLQRRDNNLKNYFADVKLAQDKRKFPEYSINNNLLTRTFIPKRGPRAGHTIATTVLPEGKLIKLALAASHDMAGHHGQHATMFAVRTRFDFPRLHTRTLNYVRGCKVCGRSKRDLRPTALGKIPVIPSFGSTVSVDFAGPLFASKNGNRHLCVIVCHATKWVHVVPTPDTTAASASAALLDFAYHNTVPKKIVSDRGSSFCNKAWRGLMRCLNIEHRPTVAYNPQGDAHAECMVKQIKALIARACQRHSREWDVAAKWAAWSYNGSWNSTLNSTPYYCKHGREPTTPPDIVFNSATANDSLSLADLVDRINDVHTSTQNNINAMHERNGVHNDKLNHTRTFSEGDECWLHRVYPGRLAPSSGGLNRSFFFPFRPDIYTIVDNMSRQHVRIKNNRTKKTQIVHTRRLKPSRPQDEAYDTSDFAPRAEQTAAT